MGRHGENIRKRKDGRWEARYMVYDAQKEKRLENLYMVTLMMKSKRNVLTSYLYWKKHLKRQM